MLCTARPLQPDAKPRRSQPGWGISPSPHALPGAAGPAAATDRGGRRSPGSGGEAAGEGAVCQRRTGCTAGTCLRSRPGRAAPHARPAPRAPAPTCAAGAARRTWLRRGGPAERGPGGGAGAARPPAGSAGAARTGTRCAAEGVLRGLAKGKESKASCAPMRARAQLPSHRGHHCPHVVSLRLHPHSQMQGKPSSHITALSHAIAKSSFWDK